MNSVDGPKTNLIEKEMNPGCRAQDQLNTNEPTTLYIKAQELISEHAGLSGNQTPDPLHQQSVLNHWATLIMSDKAGPLCEAG